MLNDAKMTHRFVDEYGEILLPALVLSDISLI